ncbi:hypothetical protein M9H77_22422 [Catharanthus roseus]|uniref:Uncharacterized protein n=1 Tax=Catharanthus roseus TaxID=4058 RepID=A0ACC0AQF8_CATRO|nr:hypothetical protein M9H77_22422 [Catharanthus roseus]
MCHELEKITKKNKELKNKIDNLSNKSSKFFCESKTLLESFEVVKKESDFSKLKFQKITLENKDLCEKVSSIEKCMVDYDDLKKKEKKPVKEGRPQIGEEKQKPIIMITSISKPIK